MNKEINGFSLWEKEPNTVDRRGKLFTRNFYFETKNKYKNRLIRVYLPSTYDFDNPDNRFPVLYMLDGKNLFDDHTSFVGEWHVDEEIEEAIARGETKGLIVVGIDAPNEGIARAEEMTPDEVKCVKNKKIKQGYASILGDFIFKTVKPIIDETFYTLSDKYHTGVGGSSSGGMMAFYLYLHYPEYINNSLTFSPAFFLYNKKDMDNMYEKLLRKERNLGKCYLYVGGKDFEEVFVKDTFYAYKYMFKNGFDHEDVKLIYDSNALHNEEAWHKYLLDALRFINFGY